MNKFSYLEYRELLSELLKTAGPKGRGAHSRLAEHMQVHSTFLTHVLNGKNHLSSEQALRVASFFSFSPLETDYFVNLVLLNRAGDKPTRDYFKTKVDEIRSQGMTIKEQLKKQTQMTPETQAVFYSEWTYSAVRLATALPEGKSVERIAKMLALPTTKVAKIVDFLLGVGLCKFENDRLTYNVFSTHAVEPFSKRLHDNWRMRSIQSGASDGEDLMFTSVVTLTKEDFLGLRDLILEMLKKYEKVTDDSEPELLSYLTIDWIKLIS